jgi:uncharacterized protein YueI
LFPVRHELKFYILFRRKIYNENTALTKESKYLGVMLDSKLTYRAHISYILRKADYRLKQLFLVSHKSSTLDINLVI